MSPNTRQHVKGSVTFAYEFDTKGNCAATRVTQIITDIEIGGSSVDVRSLSFEIEDFEADPTGKGAS